ncbi:MAG: mechanosensitive ion channel family protein [Bacteroidales bacterium]|nr:mechanosensitive ion channel family protein [Bacteroidales bacterium]
MLFLDQNDVLTAQVMENVTNLQIQGDSIVDSTKQAFKEQIQNVDSVNDVFNFLGTIFKTLIEGGIPFLLKLAGALFILWIGMKLVKRLKNSIVKMMDKRNIDKSLTGFLSSFVDVLLKVLLVIMVMDIIGIKATSFIAILGAAGLAVGFALQGTLQNFAGGVIILIMKPFKVGDYISTGVFEGNVKEIRIFNTFLTTFDNQCVILPNTDLATKSLINYTREQYRRVDINVGICYGQSVENARNTMLELANADPKVINNIKPTKVVCKAMADSSVNICLWAWVKQEDYWEVFFRLNEQVYSTFTEKGIEIAFPQVQVHMSKD